MSVPLDSTVRALFAPPFKVCPGESFILDARNEMVADRLSLVLNDEESDLFGNELTTLVFFDVTEEVRELPVVVMA